MYYTRIVAISCVYIAVVSWQKVMNSYMSYIAMYVVTASVHKKLILSMFRYHLEED